MRWWWFKEVFSSVCYCNTTGKNRCRTKRRPLTPTSGLLELQENYSLLYAWGSIPQPRIHPFSLRRRLLTKNWHLIPYTSIKPAKKPKQTNKQANHNSQNILEVHSSCFLHEHGLYYFNKDSSGFPHSESHLPQQLLLKSSVQRCKRQSLWCFGKGLHQQRTPQYHCLRDSQ